MISNPEKEPFRKLLAVSVVLSYILSAIPYQNSFAQGKQPNRLWYKAPAAYWEASLPLGNGRLGAMPDGSVFKESIVLNDITLWSGGKQNADKENAYKSLPQIRKLLSEGKNAAAEQVMNKYFICEGKGSGNADGANLPYGAYQVLGKLAINYNYGADSANLDPLNYERELSIDNALASTGFNIRNKLLYQPREASENLILAKITSYLFLKVP